MNIASVAVCSNADASALHTRLADERICIGGTTPRESYLDVERILEACAQSGADAVHPGYGFLSENEEFAEACEQRGILFIGPRASSIRRMGSKIEARRCMIDAKVPVVPGMTVGVRDLDPIALKRAAGDIGYPLLVKASFGGGGRGMRRVTHAEDLLEACQQASAEAQSAFGNAEIYLEKEIVGGRHVEVQILADAHGECVHLFERDCSMQRRHQKIVEETSTPARAAHGEQVDALCQAAVRAAQAVQYRSAGTVEFLFAPDGSFYFLEMNTRLQVEHPITELVTGVDLVREQVRIASGEPLGFTQKEVRRSGHAIECRLYAEDPATNFMPSPGPVHALTLPQGAGVRVDEGYHAGDEISSHYDSMMLKLSVWADTRAHAVRRMQRALGELRVAGTQTNLQYLRGLMAHEAFVRGDYDIGFVGTHHAEILDAALPRTEAERAVADELVIAALLTHQLQAHSSHTHTTTSTTTSTHTTSGSRWRSMQRG